MVCDVPHFASTVKVKLYNIARASIQLINDEGDNQIGSKG